MSRPTTASSLLIRYAGGVGEPDLVSALDPTECLIEVRKKNGTVGTQENSVKSSVPSFR